MPLGPGRMSYLLLLTGGARIRRRRSLRRAIRGPRGSRRRLDRIRLLRWTRRREMLDTGAVLVLEGRRLRSLGWREGGPKSICRIITMGIILPRLLALRQRQRLLLPHDLTRRLQAASQSKLDFLLYLAREIPVELLIHPFIGPCQLSSHCHCQFRRLLPDCCLSLVTPVISDKAAIIS